MKKKHIVIINSSFGGIIAALRARQLLENAKITIVEPESSLSYDVQNLKTRYNLDIRLNCIPIFIDMDAKCLVVLENKSKKRLGFDSLIYAGKIKGAPLNCASLQNENIIDGYSLNEQELLKLKKDTISHALVVGAGKCGISVSSQLSAIGVKTTLLNRSPRIASHFSLSTSYVIWQKLKESGVELIVNDTLQELLEKSNNILTFKTSSGKTLKADLVINCTKANPEVDLLLNAGASLEQEGFLKIDENLACSLSDIYVCGPVALLPRIFSNKNMLTMLPSVMSTLAQTAAENACFNHNRSKIRPFCASEIVKVNNTLFSKTGLSEEESKSVFGHENIIVTTVFGSQLDNKDFCLKLIVHKISSKILGAEVFGKSGVKRRIDLVALGISKNWTLEDLLQFDFVSVDSMDIFMEPLKEAAMRAKLILEDKSKALYPQNLAIWIQEGRDFKLVDVSETQGIFNKKLNFLHIPLRQMRDKISELQDMPNVVLYSNTGRSSHHAEQALRQMGLKNIYYLDGGAMSINQVFSE